MMGSWVFEWKATIAKSWGVHSFTNGTKARRSILSEGASRETVSTTMSACRTQSSSGRIG